MAVTIHPFSLTDALLLQVWGTAVSWLPQDSSWGEPYQGKVRVINYSPHHCSSYEGCNWYSFSPPRPPPPVCSKFTSFHRQLTPPLVSVVYLVVRLIPSMKGWNLWQPNPSWAMVASWDCISKSQLGKGVSKGVPHIFLSTPSCGSSPTSSHWSQWRFVFWPSGHYKGSSNYPRGSYGLLINGTFLCLLETVCPAWGNRISNL